MAENEKGQHDDVTFNRDELLSDDRKTADLAREKRNSPLPEALRDDPSKAVGYPIPEDRKPAVMRADQESDHDYQMKTYDGVNEKARELELAGAPGDSAMAAHNRFLSRAKGAPDMNERQAPPTLAAEAAAAGDGAVSTPTIVVDRETGKRTNSAPAAAKTSK
jgi:hypothetical protein